jgi:hypothetical protein
MKPTHEHGQIIEPSILPPGQGNVSGCVRKSSSTYLKTPQLADGLSTYSFDS